MENWCNSEGQFVYFVFNQSKVVATASSSDTVSVCSVGIYGTEYVRNGEQIQKTIEIIQGESMTLSIQRIEASLAIGNELQIALRQKTILTFVSIIENASSSQVTINTALIETGEYYLTLESFNELSQAKSALKTDTIVIQVQLEIPTPQAKILTPGSAEKWKLPLEDFLAANNQWSVEPLIGTHLQAFISYDSTAQEFEFNGDDQSKQLANQFLQITYIMKNQKGDVKNVTQIISIVSSGVELSQDVKDQDEQSKSIEQNQEESDDKISENQDQQANNTINESRGDQQDEKDSMTESYNIDEEITTIAGEYRDEVFKYMPLDDRLDLIGDNDLDSLQVLILKQKELAKQAVAKAVTESGLRPPEMRIGSISADRIVYIQFTNPMKLPSTGDFIKLNKDFKLIDVRMLFGSAEGGINKNLLSWQIIEVTSTSISIELEFESPIQVSQDEQPDLMVIQAGLSDYPDESNQRLPLSIVRVNEIPLQFASKSDAKTSKNISTVSSSAITISGIVQFSMTALLQTSLGGLWSMLNCQQIANSIPMFEKLKIPPVSMKIIKEMIEIVNFDIIPTEWLSEQLWDYWPEDDAFSLNFKTAGFEAKLFLQNAGLNFYTVLLTFFIGFLHLILLPLRRKCECVLKLTNRMKNYLYFNGTIRFFMETFFDLCLQASLNLYAVEWNTSFKSVKASNLLSIVFIGLICIFPIIYIMVSCLRPKAWTDVKFYSRCGRQLFDGANFGKLKSGERSLLFLPIAFFMRRVIFVILVLLFRTQVWLQLTCQFFISTAIIMHLQWYQPFELKMQTKIETYNEITLILLTYFLLCFTDFLPDAETRNNLGIYCSSITLLNVVVHIMIMIHQTYGKIRLCYLKRRQAKRIKRATSSSNKSSNPSSLSCQPPPKQRQSLRPRLLIDNEEHQIPPSQQQNMLLNEEQKIAPSQQIQHISSQLLIIDQLQNNQNDNEENEDDLMKEAEKMLAQNNARQI